MLLLFGSSRTLENVLAYGNYNHVCIGVSYSINLGYLFLIGRMLRLKTIMWWTGTDALKWNRVWHYRLRMRLWLPFIQEHRAVSDWIADEIPFDAKVISINPAWIYYDNTLLQTKSKT